jgi:hypothetical protein
MAYRALMATYGYDGITIVIGGNEVIRMGDMIAVNDRGEAVVAARTGIPVRNVSGVVIGVAYDLPSAAVSITNRDDLAAALGEGSEMLAAYDRFARGVAERRSVRSTASSLGARLREVFRYRILADLDRERMRRPVTADEIRARLFARPLPIRSLADGRSAPQAYAQPDPLPLP